VISITANCRDTRLSGYHIYPRGACASPSEGRGHKFESCRVRQLKPLYSKGFERLLHSQKCSSKQPVTIWSQGAAPMASLRKRNDKCQAQVRRTGHTPISKTFINRADALRWIRQTEQELDRSALAYDPSTLQRTTVADLLRRYASDVTPAKRGHASEAKRIEVFLRYDWANLTVARITPQAFWPAATNSRHTKVGIALRSNVLSRQFRSSKADQGGI
jgi:hypothetical protein